MERNPTLKLRNYGQSVWLDSIRRDLLTSGHLRQLINEDGVSGVTSNPAIFKKAIADSDDYDNAIQTMIQNQFDAEQIYQTLATEDIRHTADILRPIYDHTRGRDGFVSLEVSPHLAYDTDRTMAEARRLWTKVDRPNVMIKVPATKPGLPAIEQLITEGLNINVTLLFSLARYRQVAEAYIAGIRARAQDGLPIERVRSVASFFVSRIDTLVDQKLEKVIQKDGPTARLAKELLGQVAIAKAKKAYQIYQEIFEGQIFQSLAKWYAHPQRLLWGSTSTKNPNYSDVKYVEALIGPDTINTMHMETLEAYRDHGQPAIRLPQDIEQANQVLVNLYEVGVDINEVTQQLEEEGVQKFSEPYDELLDHLSKEVGRYQIAQAALA